MESGKKKRQERKGSNYISVEDIWLCDKLGACLKNYRNYLIIEIKCIYYVSKMASIRSVCYEIRTKRKHLMIP